MFNLELDLSGSEYIFTTSKPLNSTVLDQFPKVRELTEDDKFIYNITAGPNASFILNSLIDKLGDNLNIGEGVLEKIEKGLTLIKMPEVFKFDDKRIGLESPNIPYYTDLMNQLNYTQQSPSIYSVPAGRTYEAIRLLKVHKGFLPEFKITDDARESFLSPPESFDGTVPSIYQTPIDELYTVVNAYRASVEGFNKMGYNFISDFLIKQPTRYIDKTQETDTTKWKKKDEVTMVTTIEKIEVIYFKHTKLTVNFMNKLFEITFYNREWLSTKYQVGEEVLIIADYDRGNKLTGKTIDSLLEAAALPIVPIYPQSQKNNIKSQQIMNSIYEIIARLDKRTLDMFTYIDTSQFNMTIQEAIVNLHFPQSLENYKDTLNLLSYVELFLMQILILERKNSEVKKSGQSKPFKEGGLAQIARENLPFTLTDGQDEALKVVNSTLSSNDAEEMMISADVGAGKTIVAQLACLQTVDNGYQAVLAGPTEVLARQLYNTFVNLLEGIPADIRPTIAYLGGGMKVKEKRDIYKGIETGEINLIVGTHGTLLDTVPYSNLGLVCIDEEQKFGAGQRTALLIEDKNGNVPDNITQTATPIPRSTAQVYYGDINFVTIDQKPSGRLPIITEWIKEDPTKLTKKKTAPIWKDIKAEAELGHKTFIVVPMVNESARVNSSSVKGTLADLEKILPDLNIEFVHGQMKKAEQEERMNNFKDGDADILIASTVIEVGVDVPLGTRMIVLSADRMGASSLHQIRGRVGRNSLQSKCYLVSNNEKVSTSNRLNSLVDSNDGFEIATVDLHTRGAGDLFGDRQSGDTNLNFASLVDHTDLIIPAQKAAKSVFKSPRKFEALADAHAVLKNNEE